MAFEKQKKYNTIMMIAGIVFAAGGFFVYYYVNILAGILLMIVGISVVVITATIWGAINKVEMIEYLENRKKTK